MVNRAVMPISRMPMKRKVFPHQVFLDIAFSFSKQDPKGFCAAPRSEVEGRNL
jgi:hypothetical protein